jgi:hypothetical protein
MFYLKNLFLAKIVSTVLASRCRANKAEVGARGTEQFKMQSK